MVNIKIKNAEKMGLNEKNTFKIYRSHFVKNESQNVQISVLKLYTEIIYLREQCIIGNIHSQAIFCELQHLMILIWGMSANITVSVFDVFIAAQGFLFAATFIFRWCDFIEIVPVFFGTSRYICNREFYHLS